MTLLLGSFFLGRVMRSGVAATETAVLLPFVVMIAFASIEFTNGYYLRQSLTLGAYEAAMVVSSPQGKYEDARDACAEVLKARSISKFSMSVSPDPEADIDAGEMITVKVAAPAEAFSMGPSFFMQERSVVTSVTIVRTP